MCNEDSSWRMWRRIKGGQTLHIGAWTQAVYVLVATSAHSSRALSESACPTTSLIDTVMPYDERGRVCVACVALRAAVNGLNACMLAVMRVLAAGVSPARFTRNLGSRQKVSSFGPSAAATGLSSHGLTAGRSAGRVFSVLSSSRQTDFSRHSTTTSGLGASVTKCQCSDAHRPETGGTVRARDSTTQPTLSLTLNS